MPITCQQRVRNRSDEVNDISYQRLDVLDFTVMNDL